MFNFKEERIEKRLQKSFVMVTMMAAVAAIIALVALLILSNRYTYALNQYGFSQGDIGNAMAAFADTRSSTRAVIAYADEEFVNLNTQTHSEENRAQAQTKAANELALLFTEVYGDLTELMEVNVDKGNSLASSLQILTIVMIILIIIIIAAVMFISIKIGRSIARQMSNALNVVSERMKKFAKGDLSSDFPDYL